MVRTRVGYAGGNTPRPTYWDLEDHAEAVQIEYDPRKMSYADLLDLFFATGAPIRPPWKRQYMSALFVHDADQRRQAETRYHAETERAGQEIFVEILPADSFHLAEDRHQKYSLQRHGDLLAELGRYYPDFRDVVDSTAAARLNGWLGGARVHGLEGIDLAPLGLSERGMRILRQHVGKR